MPRVSAKWIRGPVDELAIKQDCTFDEEAGAYVVEFLETFCKQSKGEWGGQALQLLDWQADFLLRLYSWKRPDGTRRYRKGYLEVSKKNGKSTLVSGISIYHMIADGESAPECYLNACDREQARIVFDEAKRMVEASPDLQKLLVPVDSKARITCPANNGVLKAQSRETASKDGLNATLVVFDELHRQPGPEMWRVYRYSGASRRQPLILSITTAGHDRQSVCYAEHEYTEKVNKGEVLDISHLGVIYGAGPEDDYSDPAVWRKANPSMGITLAEEDFAQAYNEAIEKPSEFNEFLRLRLDVWTNAAERFIRRDKWDRCGEEPVDPEDLDGLACYCGLDLSQTRDVTAFVAVFPLSDGRLAVLCLFWLPKDNIDELEARAKVPYRTWAEQGHLRLTEGNVVDYDQVREDILEFAKTHEIRAIFADRWNATQICGQLVGAGLKVEFLGQGFAGQTEPTKELERLVLSGRLAHGNHPVLNSHVDNAQAVKGENESVKLSKAKSTGKIDGAAALVSAIAARLAEPDAGGSVYDERDMILL